MSNQIKRPSLATTDLRRVVTGLNASGRSCILIDDAAKMVIWNVDTLPADNSGSVDQGGGRFRFPTAGAQFVYSDLPPGSGSPMHTTDTIDFIVVISGSVIFVTESGETLLRAGDSLINRGAAHAWRNDGNELCRIVSVMCPAKPVGKGATITGELDLDL
jgi:quercetin dioxygenase-like cupin family protein